VGSRMVLSRRSVIAGALGVSALGLPFRASAQQATPQAISTPAGGAPEPIALGMMVEIVEDRSRLDAVIDQIGRPLAVVMFHVHWGADTGNFDQSLLDYISERGAVPMITWEAWRPLYAAGIGVAEQPDFALSRIMGGGFDAYIDLWANGLATYGKPVMLRFGHEMNGNWYPWAVGVNGNTADDFKNAWVYLRQRFAAAGADNVLWVWSPIAGAAATLRSDRLPLEDLYPGDEHVDWVGLSGFNWGTTQQSWGVAGWETFTEVFRPTYTQVELLTNKPVVVAETASAEEGGDKAAWITSAFLSELPEQFPNIRSVVWFNVLKETDWRIDSSLESLRAFVTAANNDYLQGKIG
jgi:Glycosyl hydrolase family 26